MKLRTTALATLCCGLKVSSSVGITGSGDCLDFRPITGAALESGQSGQSLAAKDEASISDENAATYVRMATDESGSGEYEMYFAAPPLFTGSHSSSITVELSALINVGSGRNWLIDVYDWGMYGGFVNIGDLASAGPDWTPISITFSADESWDLSDCVEADTQEILFRIYSRDQVDGGSGSKQMAYLDFAHVKATAGLPSVITRGQYSRRMDDDEEKEAEKAEKERLKEEKKRLKEEEKARKEAEKDSKSSSSDSKDSKSSSGDSKDSKSSSSDSNSDDGDFTPAPVPTPPPTPAPASSSSPRIPQPPITPAPAPLTTPGDTRAPITPAPVGTIPPSGTAELPTNPPITPAPLTPPPLTPAPVMPIAPPPAGSQQRWEAFAQFVPDWLSWKDGLTNGMCEDLEECRTDPSCCSSAANVCGNGVCEELETRDECNADCTHKLSVCGNGICESDFSSYHVNWYENEFTCPQDCIPEAPNLDVTSSTVGSCFMNGGDCDPVCGDGLCNGSDTCENCPRDCGECFLMAGDGICSYPFEPALVGDCAGTAVTNFITLNGEDYATIDNADPLDNVFDDASCSSTPNSIPAGWRLADWDASVGLRLVTVSGAKFDTGCLVFKEGNAVSTDNGLEGDAATSCGVIPIVQYNGGKYAIGLENCAARLMIQRIKVSGNKTCGSCSNGGLCNTLTGECACYGAWTGPSCDRAIGDFSVPPPASNWYKPALGTTWEWQIDGLPIPGANGAGSLYPVELYDIDYAYPSSVVANLKGKGKKVMCYISAGTAEDFRDDINLFPSKAVGGIVSFGEGDTFPDEKWLDLRRLDLIAPIMLDRLDVMAAKGCDAVEWDNADLPIHQTGLSDGGRISLSVQVAYNAWIAAQTHARGMGVAMKNNNEAAAFHVKDYDMVVNEECWINGNCPNYWPWIKAGKPILNTEYFTARCMYCEQANLMGLSTIKKVPDLTSCRVDCISGYSEAQCDLVALDGDVDYPIDWTIGTGAVMSTNWCPMTTNTALDECPADRFRACDENVGY